MANAPKTTRSTLELFHRFANVVERHIICDISHADARRDNEADFSTFEFFIELYSVENLPARKVRRQSSRQPELSKKINNRGALIRRQTSFFHRDSASGNNSKAHRFSMQKFPVISCALNRVPNCVSEIQKRSLVCAVTFVFRHDARFNLYVALDKPL